MKERQRNFEKNTEEKVSENPKVFHKFSRSKLPVKEQLIRLRDSERRVVGKKK